MIFRVFFTAVVGAFLVLLAGNQTFGWLTGENLGAAGTGPVAAPERPPVAVSARNVVLVKAANGHFATPGSADGRTVDFLVDTGATVVVLTSETALRLGFHAKPSDYTQTMTTANGSLGMAPMTIKELRLGQIAVNNVQAAVAPPGKLNVNLLGMSFLSRLRKFEFSGDQLILTP